MKKIAWIAIGGGLLMQPAIADELFFEATGKVAAEVTYFSQDAQFANQNYSSNLSLSIEPEFYWEWNDQKDSLTFKPFMRKDQQDGARTHGDIREFSWVHVEDDWELRTGLRKVFWGVTEFQHLVDVINQDDSIEGPGKDEKLGQPMINLSLVRDWGIVDLFALPGFRERTYVGSNSRFRSGLVVDNDLTTYESDKGEDHLDLAIRWSQSINEYDVGVHWYKGTNRNPTFSQVTNKQGNDVLKAHYQQIEQVGLDVQATIDNWLWKGEALYQQNPVENYWAAQAGFEYTYYGIQESSTDLGLLLEYGWDDRGKKATGIFQNDISVGARLTLNDAQSSELLVGLLHDIDYGSNSFQIEASQRIGDNWKASLEARLYSADDKADPISSFDKDDHIQFTLERYF